MQLSKTEEQLMQYLWKRKKAFLKDLLEDFAEMSGEEINPEHENFWSKIKSFFE